MLSSGNMGAEGGWAAEALQCVAASLRSGSAKVQWNACHAAGQALRRSDHLHSCLASELAALLDGLLEVLTTSSNFKSRTQAAAALEGLSAESVTAEQRNEALRALSTVLEAVQGRTPITRSDGPSDAGTASSSCPNAGDSRQAVRHADVVLSPAQRSDVASSELRYRAGLLTQLQKSLQHLQTLEVV